MQQMSGRQIRGKEEKNNEILNIQVRCAYAAWYTSKPDKRNHLVTFHTIRMLTIQTPFFR